MNEYDSKTNKEVLGMPEYAMWWWMVRASVPRLDQFSKAEVLGMPADAMWRWIDRATVERLDQFSNAEVLAMPEDKMWRWIDHASVERLREMGRDRRNGLRHMVYLLPDGKIKIGCKTKTIEDWEKEYEGLGKIECYSPAEIAATKKAVYEMIQEKEKAK